MSVEIREELEHLGLERGSSGNFEPATVPDSNVWGRFKQASGTILNFVGDLTIQFQNPVPSEHFRTVPPENTQVEEYPSSWSRMP